MKTRIYLSIVFLAALIVLALPFVSRAQVEPTIIKCGLQYIGSETQQNTCTICDLFKASKDLLNFLIFDLATPLVAIMLGYGGFLLLIPASAKKIEQGKKTIVNAIIGIFIVYSAWVGVDTLMKAFGAYRYGIPAPYGPWYDIECTAPVVPKPIFTPPAPPPPVSPPPETTHNECAGKTCVTAPGPGSNRCTKVGQEDQACYPETECNADALAKKYGTSPVNKEAPELRTFMSCMSAQFSKAGVSPGSIFTYELTHPLCNQTRGNTKDKCTPVCAHTIFSCHYGGSTGSQGSYAVDYGNEKAYTDIQAFAKTCGGAKAIFFESNHVHVSVNPCSGK